MATRRGPVVDVEMQRGRVVREIDEIDRPRVRAAGVEQVDERHCGDHPAATIGAGADRGPVEPSHREEERRGFVVVQTDRRALVVEDHEAHGQNGSAIGRLRRVETEIAVTPTGGNLSGARA